MAHRVHTTEHVLACAGRAGDRQCAESSLDGPEMPIMDGSAMPFIKILENTGAIEQNAERIYFELTENLSYEDPIKKVEMLAVPQDEYRATVMVDYIPMCSAHNMLPCTTSANSNRRSHVPALVFLHELEALLAHNPHQGRRPEQTAIVLVDKEVSKDRSRTCRKYFTAKMWRSKAKVC